MTSWTLTFLMAVSNFFGVVSVPIGSNAMAWTIARQWEKTDDGYYILQASSSKIVDYCKDEKNRDKVVDFPTVIHGYHKIQIDDMVPYEFGDPTFKHVHSFFGTPSFSCKSIAAGTHQVTWTVVSYTKYFARIYEYPDFATTWKPVYFFNITMVLIAAGSLIMLALFSFVIFYKRVENGLTFSVFSGCILLSFYFVGCVAPYFGIGLSMLTTHKIADTSLWVGVFCFFYTFHLRGLLGRRTIYLFAFAVILASIFILTGSSGDDVQFGTNIPFPFAFASSLIIFYSVFKSASRSSFSRSDILTIISVAVFLLCGHIDMLSVMGLWPNPVTMSIGSIGAFGISALAVNERIAATYSERDLLLVSLEKKVDEKTASLRSALSEKEAAQAELIQSAKLASLGTLSAGIAHEINNSINFVSGALPALERIALKNLEGKDRLMTEKLLASMKEGTTLTVEIVRSLRNFTGLNQAKFKDVKLREVVESVLVILRNKLRDQVEILNEIPEDLSVFGNVVGLNQVLMNIISNAMDAMPSGGKIYFTGRAEGAVAKIEIRDTGAGIPEDIRTRIFDPFFTTKEVGSGTGLGLFIVKKEIDKHKGKISIASEVGVGTTFSLEIPIATGTETEVGAA
jgi:signal transduction histidine kinase